VSHDGGPLNGGGVKECDNVSGKLIDAETALWLFRVPEATLIRYERPKPRRQQRHDPAKRKPRIWPPMQKDDRFTIIIALLCIMDLGASAQSNRPESWVCHLEILRLNGELEPKAP
jgi:hypothetical protein